LLSFEVYNDFEHPAVRETYAILEREGEHLLNTSYSSVDFLTVITQLKILFIQMQIMICTL